MLMERADCQALVEKITRLAQADDVSLRVTSSQNCHTRYANNSITTAGFTEDLAVSLEVVRERKSGAVTLTDLSEEALTRALREAEAIAALSPANPEYVKPLPPQDYPSIPAFYEESARARSADLLPGVRAVVEAAEKSKVNSYGFYSVTAQAEAVANKRGLFGYHRSTWASHTITARTPDATGSGWAEQAAPRLGQIDSARVGATAIRKGIESRQPRRLEPGKYTVILEPAALDEMLAFLAFSFGARSADEGRSFLSKRGGGNLLGEKVFGDNVSLWSDPFDPRVPARPWANDLLPAEKTAWVESGVVRNLIYDRYWAQKNDRKPTPFPSNVIMAGGTATLEDLVASTERGLLVTRFWYIRFLQPQTVQLTGLTRDGVFYIEKGKVQYPVTNFRFNQSVVHLLNNIEALTPAVPVGDDVLPAVRAREFNFSSVSDAV